MEMVISKITRYWKKVTPFIVTLLFPTLDMNSVSWMKILRLLDITIRPRPPPSVNFIAL